LLRIGKRSTVIAGVVSLVAGVVLPSLGGGAAYAGTVNYVFNAVGSDTIYCLDNSTATAYDSAQSSTTGDTIANSAPVLDFSYYCGNTPLKDKVAKDSVHKKITYACSLQNAALSAKLTAGNTYTSLTVGPTAAALQSGKNITVGSGATADTFVTSAAVAQGSTSIPVASEVANNAEAAGTAVYAPDCIPGDGATGNLPPDGSSAGIAALVADNGQGNIAYARSSRGPKSSDDSNLLFWAFALDGVSWSTFPGTDGPSNLTTTDLEGIVKCTITNWDQITDITGYTGPDAPIQLWYPQLGSGTGSFFDTLFNGGNNPGSCATYGEENSGESIASQGSFVSAEAIYPYSASVWNAQNAANTGATGGATLGEINGVSPYTSVGAAGHASTDNYSEANADENVTGDACTDASATGFCASRFVYHVTDSLLGSGAGFAPAAYATAINDIVAINAGASKAKTGYCGNKYASEITSNGFETLVKAPTGGSYPNSYCRLFTP
jgi:hypothetical protein